MKSMWQQMFSALESILIILSCSVVWRVSILPWISSFSCLFSEFFGTVSRAPTMIAMIVTFVHYHLSFISVIIIIIIIIIIVNKIYWTKWIF